MECPTLIRFGWRRAKVYLRVLTEVIKERF